MYNYSIALDSLLPPILLLLLFSLQRMLFICTTHVDLYVLVFLLIDTLFICISTSQTYAEKYMMLQL